MVSKFKFYSYRTWAKWNSWFGLPLFLIWVQDWDGFDFLLMPGPRQWALAILALGFFLYIFDQLRVTWWLKPIIVQQPWLRYWKPLGVASLSDYHNHWILQKSTLASSLVECIYNEHHCFHTTVVTQKLIFSKFLHYFIFTLKN